ncbi:LysR family transcriptional regulator [Agrobacterium rhizogenes]|uniref:LysR family transcriptional regulator n=1 Tax=Rhizobium rhizogenes TaxID=359 RepID=UPI0015741722|nr:LysR family transcriptional regulator [Rhizobium rhizogenes]NTF53019.1 LysR family transcriptional regulator [Rhizobium rhizogenes]NTF65956.1 LysR family transcriptional regulator [Rhizobium rhizogenes]NTF98053.1 LysR family transcriptional regulator [Rhizobium rhizogenes]NTG05178.1 LysR family transcriptional regulator [Rhizobium rhizogenes]NTG18472.1 LysR family transcriptional regulator [Rhizobium rhizogenes]
MRFQRLDLNLLVVLDALLSERSVSLAAERICLSQSATSSALGRLREYFGDDLLIVKGRQMVLTTRAASLVEPVRVVLEQIRMTISVTPPFDPAVSVRTISIMASDYITEVLLGSAINQMAAEAPNMRFEIHPLNDGLVESLERGFTDLLITIDYAISPDHPSDILFEEDYVVVGWSGNPAMKGPMTKELYFALGHVTARFGQGRVSAFEDWFVRRNKLQRRVEVVTPTFLSLPGLVVGSSRIATMHRRLAIRMTDHMPLTIREVPFDIPRVREAVQWHISNNNDKAIRWVVARLKAMALAEPGMCVPYTLTTRGVDRASHDEIIADFQTHAAHGGKVN